MNGFKNGFPLGYQGDKKVEMKSPNLRLSVGTHTELWNKVMSEVQKGRYAGPYKHIPFKHYIQSPIGLVPKDGGTKTRLIFHLSYPRIKSSCEHETSVNGNTPKHLTSVKYQDIETAVSICYQLGKGCFAGKSDMSSAFRHLGMRKKDWKYLVMKAKSPKDGKVYYFVDKCMPFGAAISCSHFQRFSNAVSHLVKFATKRENVNYLDDFLFLALLARHCNVDIQAFLDICSLIKFPIALEKTFWATTRLVFLGILIDTQNQLLLLPSDKINKALDILREVLERKNKKVKRKELERICGLLNFFSKCVIPGRAFTRRLYSYGSSLKPHHHIYMNKEIKNDLKMWVEFLQHPAAFARPFHHFTGKSREVHFFTDASRNHRLGCGGICGKSWFFARWPTGFVEQKQPSIAFLELVGVAIGIVNWIHRFKDQHVTIFCDNQSVIHMVNNTTSGCKNCMTLIRLITLKAMIHNVVITAKYVRSKDNLLSDKLSRMQIKQFKKLTKGSYNTKPDRLPSEIWPITKLWSD